MKRVKKRIGNSKAKYGRSGTKLLVRSAREETGGDSVDRPSRCRPQAPGSPFWGCFRLQLSSRTRCERLQRLVRNQERNRLLISTRTQKHQQREICGSRRPGSWKHSRVRSTVLLHRWK